MKLNTQKTKKGYEIVAISQPDKFGYRVGGVNSEGQYVAVVWDSEGEARVNRTRVPAYDLEFSE